MQKNQPKGSVRTRIVWFHIAMMFGALTPGVIICFLWLIKDSIFLAGFLFLVYLAASIGMGRFIYIESVRQVDKFTPILSSEE